MISNGYIYDLYLDPVVGSEQAGRRPAIVVSGNLLNKHLSTVIVVPLTTRIKNYQGNPILEPDWQNGLEKTSEAMVLHIRSISKERLGSQRGEVPSEVMSQIRETLSDIMTL